MTLLLITRVGCFDRKQWHLAVPFSPATPVSSVFGRSWKRAWQLVLGDRNTQNIQRQCCYGMPREQDPLTCQHVAGASKKNPTFGTLPRTHSHGTRMVGTSGCFRAVQHNDKTPKLRAALVGPLVGIVSCYPQVLNPKKNFLEYFT